jgi:hypothetical protein
MLLAVPRAPDWLPLERALTREYGEVAREAAIAFWFIGYVDGPHDVGELRVYEHARTRRRLALAADGRAYRQPADQVHFSPVALADALIDALT